MATPRLERRLGLLDAVVIGLGSMVGAGVFAVWAPAAAVAGTGLLLGLGLALMVAYCNATSSAQLAAQYPTSGGTYVYGRERLGEWPGFLAGWGFVIGKTASVAAMALTLGAAVAPALPMAGPDPASDAGQRVIAVLAVVVLTAVNLRGVTRTARATRVLLAIVLPALALACAGLWFGPSFGWFSTEPGGPRPVAPTAYGVLQAAGLLFFAFAGYARIATLGEEVRDPARTIPRAILLALSITAVVYAVVGTSLVARVGAGFLAHTSTPLTVAGWAWANPLVAVAAVLAAAGAMLNLMTGIGRTCLAMARHGDLPAPLAAVDPRHSVPRTAELILAAVVIVLVLVGDVRTVIGFSSFGVLLYYLVANLAAYTQDAAHRRFPRALQVVGAVLCLALVATLPWVSIVVGLAVYAVGALVRLALRSPGP